MKKILFVFLMLCGSLQLHAVAKSAPQLPKLWANAVKK